MGKIVVLYYVDDCVYWYTSKYLVKCFVDNLGNIFHVKLLGYAHWFMPIRIYQMKARSISVDHAWYDTYIDVKYMDTAIAKARKNI